MPRRNTPARTGFFRTPSKKIEIYSDALEQVGFDPLPSYLEPERGPVRGKKSFWKNIR